MSVRLESVCEITMGQAPSGESYNDLGEGLPLLAGAGDFRGSSPSAKKFTRLVTKRCIQGDIILGIRASIGDKVLADREYCLGRGVAGLRPKIGKLDSRYLWHWLSSIQPELERRAKGATFKQVNRNDIGGLALDLPQIDEQRRIAAILDQAEELRSKRRAAIALLDQLPQAIFLEMFGNHVQILKNWPTVKLGSALDYLTSGSRGWANYYADSGALFLRIQNVRRDELDLRDVAFVRPPSTKEAQRTRVAKGDVLLSITADLGRSAVVDERVVEGFINQHLAILRPTSSLNSRFLSSFIASGAGQAQIQSKNRHGVKAGLNFDDVRSVVTPLPPLDLQCEFAARVETIHRTKAAHQSALAELDDLLASLQIKAFNGGFH